MVNQRNSFPVQIVETVVSTTISDDTQILDTMRYLLVQYLNYLLMTAFQALPSLLEDKTCRITLSPCNYKYNILHITPVHITEYK